MNWNDELCGVKVTPESWAGGVLDYGGTLNWRIHPYTLMLIVDMPKYAAQARPIFPPRGWAGLTDAELWAAVFQNCDAEIGHYVRVMRNGKVYLQCHTIDNEIYVPDPAALILALQNAQVLARRLA